MWSKPKPQEADPIYYKSGCDSSVGSGIGGYGYPAQTGTAQYSNYGHLANSCGGNGVWMNGREATVPYRHPANQAAVWNNGTRVVLPLQSSTNHPEVWNNGAGASEPSLNSTSANPPGFTNNGWGSPYPSPGSQQRFQEGRVVPSQGSTRPNYPSCSMDNPGPKSSFPASTQMYSSRYTNYPGVNSFFPNSSPIYTDASPSYRSSAGSTPSYPSSGSNCPSSSPSFPTSGQRLDSCESGIQQGYHAPGCNIFNQVGSNQPNRFHGMDWKASRYAKPDNFYDMDVGSWSSSGATSGDEQAASNWSGSYLSDQNYSKDWHASGFSGRIPTFGRGYQHCNNPQLGGNNLQPTTDSDEDQEAWIAQQGQSFKTISKIYVNSFRNLSFTFNLREDDFLRTYIDDIVYRTALTIS